MKEIESKLVMRLSAAAVALALGASTAFAQQPGAGDQSRQQTQQQSGAQSQRQGAQQQGAQQGAQRQGAQQQGGAQQRQAASGQQRQGDSQLDKVVQQHQELGTFVEALEQAGLVEELAGNTEYTIFAPTDQAFEAMDQDVAELMQPQNRQELVALLRNHIVADDVDPQMARQLTEAKTLDGDTIALSTENSKLMIGEASVVTPNIQVEGSNLRIYTIDKVLGKATQTAAAGGSERERG